MFIKLRFIYLFFLISRIDSPKISHENIIYIYIKRERERKVDVLVQCFPTIFRKSTQLGLSVPRDRTAATFGDAPSSKCYFSRMYAVIGLKAFNVLA